MKFHTRKSLKLIVFFPHETPQHLRLPAGRQIIAAAVIAARNTNPLRENDRQLTIQKEPAIEFQINSPHVPGPLNFMLPHPYTL